MFEGRRVLHVHLGMDGRFRHHRSGPEQLPRPPRSVDLRVSGPAFGFDLTHPKVCQVVDVLNQRAVAARLGPDPIRVCGRPTP